MSNLRQLEWGFQCMSAIGDDTYPYDIKPRTLAGPDAMPAYDGTNKWDGSPIVGF